MARREFIEDCEVRDKKTTLDGVKLPEGEILVKLKDRWGKTFWMRMTYEDFKMRKVFKELETGCR